MFSAKENIIKEKKLYVYIYIYLYIHIYINIYIHTQLYNMPTIFNVVFMRHEHTLHVRTIHSIGDTQQNRHTR